MKKLVLALALLAFLGMGAANADTLAVNATAAMGGTGTACGGGNCGLEVIHDNSSAAYVQDNSPSSETVYRGSFMFDPNNISDGVSGNWRQEILKITGTNPNPNTGVCTGTAFADAAKAFAVFTQGGVNYRIQGWIFGNQCGARGLNNIAISASGAIKICYEWANGSSDTGYLALAVVGTTDACPSSGGGAWTSRTTSNNLTFVEQTRMGVSATNNFGVGENGSMYFDEFESFRTVTP